MSASSFTEIAKGSRAWPAPTKTPALAGVFFDHAETVSAMSL